MINEKNLGLSQDEINTMKNKMTEIKTRFHNKEDLYEYARLHNDSVVIIVNLKSEWLETKTKVVYFLRQVVMPVAVIIARRQDLMIV